MLRRSLVAAALSAFLLVACARGQFPAPGAPGSPGPATAPAATAPPTSTPALATGSVPYVANLRSGPAMTWPIVGAVAPGQKLTIVNCNEDCSWYQVESGGWLLASLVDLDAPFPPPPTPVAAAPLPTLNPVAGLTPALSLPSEPPAPVLPGAGDSALTVVGWNVESGGADPAVIAQRIAGFADVDLWGLSEVHAADAAAFEAAAEVGEGTDYGRILGASGNADRLLILYDTSRFDLIDSQELHAMNPGGTGRAPLYAHLHDRRTGVEFLFMVNHLYRGDERGRHEQARQLNDWAESQALPVIAVGDYNFDYSIRDGSRDRDLGYDLLTADGVFKWLRPPALVTTQCSGWPCRYQSILDFVFVSGAAQGWPAASDIVFVPNDFPDNELTSDHRPVRAVLDLPG